MSDDFDINAFAARRGIKERGRPAALAELFGMSEIQMRRVVSGATKPSGVLIVAAKALERIVELEDEANRLRQAQVRAGIAELSGGADTDMTTDDIMDETRDRKNR